MTAYRRPCPTTVAVSGQLPMAAFARHQHIGLSVVDCGVAEDLHGHERLLARKIGAREIWRTKRQGCWDNWRLVASD